MIRKFYKNPEEFTNEIYNEKPFSIPRDEPSPTYFKNPYNPKILFDIDKKYWSLKCIQKIKYRIYNYSLGNLSDTGWYWHEEGTDTFGLFLQRIADSEIKNEFLSEPTIQKYSDMILNDLKLFINNDPETLKWILYGISGDNKEWYGNQGIISDLLEDYPENIVEKAYDEDLLNFDTFYKWIKNKTRYLSEIKDNIIASDTLSELFNYFSDTFDLKAEILQEYIYSHLGLPEDYK